MKSPKIAATIFSTVLMISACSGNKSTPGNNGPVGSSTQSGDTTFNGDNSFTYTIGDRHVAIKDFVHKSAGKSSIALFINEVKNDDANGMIKINITNEITFEVFNFTIANKGTTSIQHNKRSLVNFANKKNPEAIYMSPKYTNYYGDSLVLTINSIDGKHVTGTFAGKFVTDENGGGSVQITDGSFDLQFGKN